jgi:hypothetical protein
MTRGRRLLRRGQSGRPVFFLEPVLSSLAMFVFIGDECRLGFGGRGCDVPQPADDVGALPHFDVMFGCVLASRFQRGSTILGFEFMAGDDAVVLVEHICAEV